MESMNDRVRHARATLLGWGVERHTMLAVLAMLREPQLSYRAAAARFHAECSNVYRASRHVPEVREARASHRRARVAA